MITAALDYDAKADAVTLLNPPRVKTSNGANGHGAPNRQLTGIDFADMEAHLLDGFLIKGFIAANSTVGLIGPTGSGKTFFATDMAMHLSAGRPFRGMPVKGGLVVYAALEGPMSAVNRFVACRKDGEFPPGIPLRLTPGPINLRTLDDRDLLLDFIRTAQQDHGESCTAVFIDTMARAMCGGDENASEDMGALIAGSDFIRLETGASMILVHHLGKDTAKGARGHSSFKAALDTEIEIVEEGDVRVASVTKQRDLPSGTRLAFKLRTVELGHDSDGDPVTTCVVDSADAPLESKKEPTSQCVRDAIATLRTQNQPIMTLREVQEALKPAIADRRRRSDAVVWLQKNQYLTPTVGGLRLEF